MIQYHMHVDEAGARASGLSAKAIRQLKEQAARGRAAHLRDLKYPLTVHVRDDFTRQQRDHLQRLLGPKESARVGEMFRRGDYAGVEKVLHRHKKSLHLHTR